MSRQPGFSERLALIERAKPLRFNLILFGVIAAGWVFWSPVQAAAILLLGTSLRAWLFRAGDFGDRILARYWGWDQPQNSRTR